MNHLLVSPSAQLASYCLLVALASLAGGWILLAVRLTHLRLQIAASFVAGLMLSMALLHFIPHAVHQNLSIMQTMRDVLAGFLAMFLLQRFFPHHHHDVSEEAPERSSAKSGGAPTLAEQSASHLSWIATTVGMTLHSLVGGMALAAAVSAGAAGRSGWLGLGTALVIILHKPFDALAVSTVMTAGRCSISSRHLINTLFALVTPLGAALFYLGVSRYAAGNPGVLGGALAFCAGTFLCIAGGGLLPEMQFHAHDRIKLSLALLAGVAVAVLVGLLGHHEPAHHEPGISPPNAPHAHP
jgi:zinc and cadmium transporter